MAAAGDAGRAPQSVADATHDLYRQYGKQIYAYCLHQLRSREEAEDAVQTTFLNAFRGLQRGTTTRFEQAWLYKIAQNVCIARRSSSGRRLKLEAPDDFDILEEIVPSAQSAGENDTLELMGLDEALDSMPENQRRAILLREWQGLSYREIAEELGLSQGAVEMLIFRARRTLATALEQPAAAAKKRGGSAKTGFSFGSLVAAMKSLFSTGAGIKMAAVAATTAAVIGTNVVHSVVKPFIPAKQPTQKARVATSHVQAAVVPSTPVRTPGGTAAVRTVHGAASSASTVTESPSSGGATGHKPVIPETVPASRGGSAPASPTPVATGGTTASNDTSSSTAPVVTLTPASSATTPRKPGSHRVSPSNGAHHSGASMPAPTSLGTPGDTTTPHQHGPTSVGPTNASSDQSSSDATSDPTAADGGPVSIAGGPVGYSSGGATQASTTGNTPRGGSTTSGGDTSTQGDSSPDPSGDTSSSDGDTSSSSSDTSTTTQTSDGSDSSSSDSSDSSDASQGRGNGSGDGGGGHHHHHHGDGRSIQNAG